jgi:chromosome segregation ATPase
MTKKSEIENLWAQIVRLEEAKRHIELQLENERERTQALAHLLSTLMPKVQAALGRSRLLDCVKELPEIQKELSQILGMFPTIRSHKYVKSGASANPQ